MKKEALRKLRENKDNPDLCRTIRYYMCVPDQCAHTNHALGSYAGLGQPIDQRVKEKIYNLTNAGML